MLSTNKTRKISTKPERVLYAPGMVDDFYPNVLSWSSLNCIAVALESSTYIWKADTGAPSCKCARSPLEHTEVEVWDVARGTKLRTMAGHQAQSSDEFTDLGIPHH
ncbi:hypothetical protein B0H13DRAFT_2306579 [Mycena leptocephala]|nr:hypothetical protein B0H13DRAFT_2306579 [Mycena leptocephala]